MAQTATTDHPIFDFTIHPSLSPFTISPPAYLAAHPNEGYKYLATGTVVFDSTSDPKTPRVLLLQRSAGDSMPNRWECPGGGCDDEDESVLYAAARELWEEAGLRATRFCGLAGPAPQLFLSSSRKEIGKFNFIVEAEMSRSREDGDEDDNRHFAVKLDPKEHQRYVWASEAEVRAKKVARRCGGGDIVLEFTKKVVEDTILQAFEQSREK